MQRKSEETVAYEGISRNALGITSYSSSPGTLEEGLLIPNNTSVQADDQEIDALLPPNQASKRQKSRTSRCIKFSAHKLLYAVPLVYALNDTDAISQINDKVPSELAYTIGAVSFVSSFALYGPVTLKGMNEAYSTFRTRHLPADWHNLTRKREIAAMSIASIAALYIAANDGVSSFYFAKDMPGQYKFKDAINENLWLIPCITMGALTGVSLVFSEGFEIYQAARDFLAKEQVTHYHNQFSSYVSPGIGYSIGAIGFFKDGLTGFIGMTNTWKIKDTAGLSAIAAASIMPGMGEFALTGRLVRDQIDAGIEHVKDDGVSAKDVTSLLLAMSAAALLAYAYVILMQKLCKEAFDDFGVNNTEFTHPIIDGFSYVCAVQEFAVDVASLQPVTSYAVNSITTNIAKAYNSVTGRCRRPVEIIDDEPIDHTGIPPVHRAASPLQSEASDHDVVIIDMQASDYTSSEDNASSSSHAELVAPPNSRASSARVLDLSGNVSDTATEYHCLIADSLLSDGTSIEAVHDFSGSDRTSSSIYSRPGSPVLYQPIKAPRQLVKAHSTGDLHQDMDDNLRRKSL